MSETEKDFKNYIDRKVDILERILAERRRQDAKWGEQNHKNAHSRDLDQASSRLRRRRELNESNARHGCTNWNDVLLEEVEEAVEQAALGDDEKLTEELVQCAAVIVAWIECIERRKTK